MTASNACASDRHWESEPRVASVVSRHLSAHRFCTLLYPHYPFFTPRQLLFEVSAAMSQLSLGEEILRLINAEGKINSLDIAAKLGVDHQKVVGALKSLDSLGDVISWQQIETKKFELTKEGEGIVENGSHEAVVWRTIPDDGIEQPSLMKALPSGNVGKLGFSKAMSHGWILIDKSSGTPVVKRKVDSIDDEVQKLLTHVKNLRLDNVSNIKIVI